MRKYTIGIMSIPSYVVHLFFTVMMTLLVVLQTNVKIFFNEFLTINNKWDQLFQSLDVFLFIGHHPWKIISSAIPHDILQLLIIILDANYMFWFCIQWFFVFDATYIAPKAYRKEALLNFVMVWVLGTQMGGLFTSGGPFFNMTNTHNVEQIQFLLDLNFSFNLMCIKAQGFLWDVFLGGTNLKSGISAFPSLHVGISYLVYRFSCKRAPVWLRRFCFIFFILIYFNKYTGLDSAISIISSLANSGLTLVKSDNNLSLYFLLLTIIGGSLISNTSGIKLTRFYILLKITSLEIIKLISPNSVINKTIFNSDKKITDENVKISFLIFISFFLSLFILSSLLVIDNIGFEKSFKLSILTLTNTLNSEMFDMNNINFSNLLTSSKISLILFMIIGKIELVSIFLIFKKILFKD